MPLHFDEVENVSSVSPEVKAQICQRVLSSGPDHLSVAQAAQLYGLNRTTIYFWVDKAKQLPLQDGKRTVEPAPLPSQGTGKMNAKDALELYHVCKHLGFDSPAVGECCRKAGVKFAELKKYGDWFEANFNADLLSKAPEQRNAISNLQQQVVELRKSNDAMGKELAQRDETIVSQSMELAVLKKLKATFSQ